MLHPLRNFEALALHALDCEIGPIEDFWFDDRHWAIRYLVVNTGRWPVREVLISPVSTGVTDWNRRRLDVRLTRDQILNSPHAVTDVPFTPQLERAYVAYFHHAPYWVGGRLWGTADTPGALAMAPRPARGRSPLQEPRLGALRSVRELRGSHLRTRDRDVGYVQDVFIQEGSWRIRYLLVDTSNFLGSRTVLVPRELVTTVDWADRRLHVDTIAAGVRNAPRVQAAQPLDRAGERPVKQHYAIASPRERRRVLTAGRGG